ncbi:unnamed protein product [Amoebophrya sp. A120]|nr:unnamed protein product [Amoebophrya sp. A120]|eukprot:GSA120T00022135001.1
MNYEPLVAAQSVTNEQKRDKEKEMKRLYGGAVYAKMKKQQDREEKENALPFFQSYVDVSKSFVVEFHGNRLQPVIDWSYNVISNRLLSGEKSSVFLGLIIGYVRSPVYRELFSSKVGRRWLISFFVRYRTFADWDSVNINGQSVLSLANDPKMDKEFRLLINSIQQKCIAMVEARQK